MMKNIKNIANTALNNVEEQHIFQNNADRREYHDALMREAFEDALMELDGHADLIASPDYADVRDDLLDSMAAWMRNVGNCNKAAFAYLRLSPNNHLDEVTSHFFSAGCMNNRLQHYLTLTAAKNAQVALKSLQESVINATRDLLPRKDKQTTASSVQMVDMESVERTLSTGDNCSPQHAAACREELGMFWQLLYQKPFLQIMAFMAQPLGYTRKELANLLLHSDSAMELFEEIREVFTSLLADKARVNAALAPIKVMVQRYEPEQEHVSNPDKLINLLYRYTGSNGALDKFYAEFRKAIAA